MHSLQQQTLLRICSGCAAVRGNEQDDRLAGTSGSTTGLQLGRADALVCSLAGQMRWSAAWQGRCAGLQLGRADALVCSLAGQMRWSAAWQGRCAGLQLGRADVLRGLRDFLSKGRPASIARRTKERRKEAVDDPPSEENDLRSTRPTLALSLTNK